MLKPKTKAPIRRVSNKELAAAVMMSEQMDSLREEVERLEKMRRPKFREIANQLGYVSRNDDDRAEIFPPPSEVVH